MRQRAYLAILVLSASFLFVPTSNAAAPVTGKSCTKLGQQQTYKSQKFTCVKSGKKTGVE
jgi:hypothetical protein